MENSLDAADDFEADKLPPRPGDMLKVVSQRHLRKMLLLGKCVPKWSADAGLQCIRLGVASQINECRAIKDVFWFRCLSTVGYSIVVTPLWYVGLGAIVVAYVLRDRYFGRLTGSLVFMAMNDTDMYDWFFRRGYAHLEVAPKESRPRLAQLHAHIVSNINAEQFDVEAVLLQAFVRTILLTILQLCAAAVLLSVAWHATWWLPRIVSVLVGLGMLFNGCFRCLALWHSGPKY